MSTYKDDIDYLRKVVPVKDAMVLLAEECGELAQAAIKYYRLSSKSIPTPLQEEEIREMLKEELTDILVTAEIAGIKRDANLFDEKIDRWIARIKEKEERISES